MSKTPEQRARENASELIAIGIRSAATMGMTGDEVADLIIEYLGKEGHVADELLAEVSNLANRSASISIELRKSADTMHAIMTGELPPKDEPIVRLGPGGDYVTDIN